MSGFFALRRETFSARRFLNPIGYKIGLELLVKCRCARVAEVPIAFADRIHGESKLSLREQLRYLRHLRRLFLYRYGTWSEVMQFMVVGASGVLVNLAGVTMLLRVGVPAAVSIAVGIVASICTNFYLNRRFTFSHSRTGTCPASSWVISSRSPSARWSTTSSPWLARLAARALLPQLASLGGIGVATVVNFVALKYIVFKHKHYRPR